MSHYILRKLILSIVLSVLTLFGLKSVSLAQTHDNQEAPQRLFIKCSPGSRFAPPTMISGTIQNIIGGKTEDQWLSFFNDHRIYSCKKAFRTQHRLLDDIYELTIPRKYYSQNVLSALQNLSGVLYAEPAPVYPISIIPDDYHNFSLDHLDVINAPEAWDITTGDPSIRIAVIDEAIMINHEDLRDNIWTNPGEIEGNGIDDDRNGFVDDIQGYDVASEDPDPNPITPNISHGTLVSGCAAAVTNNSLGIASIGYASSIIPIKASNTIREITHALQALDYAISVEADIVNFSFGSPQFNQTFANLVKVANEKGMILVAAAGNDGEDVAQFPAQYPEVINVGFTGPNDRVASASNFGPSIDIMAPGTRIWVPVPDEDEGTYTITSGSSLASPIVAGLLALMKSVHPCLNPKDALTLLKQTAINIDSINPGFEGLIGAGRINALEAVRASMIRPPVANFTHSPIPSCGGKVSFYPDSVNNLFSCEYEWTIFDSTQALIFTSTLDQPSFIFDESANYTVNLRVSNSAGEDQIVNSISVEILDTVAIELHDVSLCIGDTISIPISATGDTSAISWFPIEGLSRQNILQPLLSPSNTTNYFLEIETSEGCISRDTLAASVFPNPTTFAIGDEQINAGDTVQLFVIGAEAYRWRPDSSLSDPTISNPLAFPLETTWYIVEGTNGQECTSLDSVLVEINVATHNSRSLNREFSVEAVYPNPARENIHLSAHFNKGGLLRVQLISMLGNSFSIYTGSVVPGSMSFQFDFPSSLAAGVYRIQWEMDEARKSQALIIF